MTDKREVLYDGDPRLPGGSQGPQEGDGFEPFEGGWVKNPSNSTIIRNMRKQLHKCVATLNEAIDFVQGGNDELELQLRREVDSIENLLEGNE